MTPTTHTPLCAVPRRRALDVLTMPLLTTTEIEEGILLLTITRPERRNALSSNTLAALHREIDRIAGDPAVRVVVSRAKGSASVPGRT